MWTTSNSHAKERRFARLFACAAFVTILACSDHSGSGTVSAQEIAPDAPRSARASIKPPSSTQRRYPRARRIELRSVAVRRLDERMAKLAGADFLKRATAPLVIEVRTQEPLGDLTRTSSPVILLNGDTLSETVPLMPNRLVAFLPDRKLIRNFNTVAIVWLGNEELTKSRRPLSFRSGDVK